MKKQHWIILLAVIFCFVLVLTACGDTHECGHKCEICGKCTDKTCDKPECADKCLGHGDPPYAHVCQNACPVCGKCMDASCTDSVCADKCLGHVEVVKVTEIIPMTEDADDSHDGSLENPLHVQLAQSESTDISYTVRPNNATNKTVTWTVGTITDGVFAAANTGVTITDAGSKITVSAAATATSCAVEGKADDATIYLAIDVEQYIAVESITSSTFTAVEGQDYDYEFTTALYTNWDVGGGILPRGQELLNGQIFGGKQAPLNLTYFGNIYNAGIIVAPADATNKDVTISYSTEGIVEIDALGALTTKGAGETIVTVASEANPEVTMKVKITVVDSLYRGILASEYENATVSANTAWDLDPNDDLKGGDAQMAAYGEWHLVMVHSNYKAGKSGIDNNQKIFYMGSGDKPYGVSLENNIGASSGGNLQASASLMWAKLTIPAETLTFNVKLNNNDKTHGMYRVVFVEADGTATVLSDGWQSFASPSMASFIAKLSVPQELWGKTGAMVIEHRVTEYDNNAELHIYKMNFEGNVAVTGVQFGTDNATFLVGEREFNISAVVKPDNATNDKVLYAMAEGSAAGVTVDATGKVTVSATAEAGEYIIVATAAGDETKTATFKLTLTDDEIVVNEWDGKNAIMNGVSDVKWELLPGSGMDYGVGEGADLNCNNGQTWSAIYLANRKIKADAPILTFGARVFVRNGETYPHFKVKVIVDGEETYIQGIGLKTDYFYVESDDVIYCSYDLTAYVGKTVEIQIGITRGTHAAVAYIGFGNVVEATGVAFKTAAAEYKTGAREIDVKASVKPAKVTDHRLTYAMAESSANKGVTVDATTGHVVISEDAPAGVYEIVATCTKDPTKTATFTLTLTGETIIVNEWIGAGQILDGVADVKWDTIGQVDKNGEGADLRSKEVASNGWAAIKLANRKVESSNCVLTIGVRVYNRGGETWPHFIVKVDGTVIRAIGATEDFVTTDSDDIRYFSYDLSAYVGQTVEIQIGDDTGTHGVVNNIKFTGNTVTDWNNKAALLDAEKDPWTVTGAWNQGPGEGIDLNGAGSYASNEIVVCQATAKLTVGLRIFFGQEGDKGNPSVKLVVVVNGEEHVINAIGAEGDTVVVNTEGQTASYDLSAYLGQKVEIRIVCVTEVYHCIIQNAKLEAAQ